MISNVAPVPSNKNIPYLDGWRGLAIIMVLIDHFGPARFWYFGRLGVVLFFVLSGLFMGRLLFVKRVHLPSFFAKRFSRIIPTLWVYVAAMWFYSTYLQPDHFRPSGAEVASVLSFTSTYFVSIWEAKWPIGHLWSLNVEEHGYAFLAVGAAIIAATRGRLNASAFLLASIVAICLCDALYMTDTWVVTGSPWRTRSEVAALGLVASAAICVWKEDGWLNWLGGGMWISLIALAIALRSFAPRGVFAWNFSIVVAPILLALAVNYAYTFPQILKRALSFTPLRWFGTCSFSIYLWQGPFYSATLSAGASKPVCLIGGIAAGALSFYYIENPARRYLNRKWDAFTSQRSAAPVIEGAA